MKWFEQFYMCRLVVDSAFAENFIYSDRPQCIYVVLLSKTNVLLFKN